MTETQNDLRVRSTRVTLIHEYPVVYTLCVYPAVYKDRGDEYMRGVTG